MRRRGSTPSGAAACVMLGVMLAACAVTGSTVVIAVVVTPVVAGLLAIELDRSGGLFGRG